MTADLKNYKSQVEQLRKGVGCNNCGKSADCTHDTCLVQTEAADAIEELIRELHEVKSELSDLRKVLDMYGGHEGITNAFKKRDAARRAVRGKCHQPPDALPPGARCAQKDCQWYPYFWGEM